MGFKKKKVFIVFIYFSFSILYSQVTRVTYRFDIYDIKEKNKTTVIAKQKSVLETEMFKVMNEGTFGGTFELFFDKTKSIFRKIQKLNIEENNANEFVSKINSEIYYKNLLTSEKIVNDNVTDGNLNIIKPINEYDWKITTDTKTINGYKCYKATCEKQDYYNPIKKTANIFNITVWFTPEIPSNFGPQGLDGLPGLVLEGTNNGKKYIYATKIEFDFKKEVKIEKPKCDKTVTEKEFGEILAGSFKKIQDEMGN